MPSIVLYQKGDVCDFTVVKKRLLGYKLKVKKFCKNDDEAFGLYIKKAFELFDDEWDIIEAFSYYNEDKRVQINKQKQQRKRVSSSDIHIATQFFTPKWLSQYIIENSLGRFFPTLKKEYCDGDIKLAFKSIEELKILDPAIGVGNMLLCAYDLMEKVYIESGISEKQIPYKILSSFYGLDIDKRAVETAKRLLLKRAGIKQFKFNIYVFNNVSDSFLLLLEREGYHQLAKLLQCLNSYKLGSIISPYAELGLELEKVLDLALLPSDRETLLALSLLLQKYDNILMNPPYLTSSDYPAGLREYIYKEYSMYKHDLFSVFIARSFDLLQPNGLMGVVCPYNWMFIKSFTQLRKLVIFEKSIYNLLQLASDGYNKAVVYLSAFVVANIKREEGYYIRLADFKGSQQQIGTKKAINSNVAYRYVINQEIFKNTPNYSMIYWYSKDFLAKFRSRKLSDFLEIRQGMATGDNKRFLKRIEDVDKKDIAFDASSIADFDKKNKKYALYNKGGKFRKWYGNIEYVIAFDKHSRRILATQGNKMPSSKFYFQECITWTLVSSKGHFGARYSNNSVFDVGGSCGFIKKTSPISLHVILGYLCSKVASSYLYALNPTLNMQVGDIKNLPFIVPSRAEAEEIERLVKANIEISKNDWYNVKSNTGFEIVKRNEERINEIFIKLFSLQDILSKEVASRLITVRRENED